MALRCALVLVSYQSSRFLPACLDSALGQLRHFDRIVVVDNDSGDGSADLARRDGVEVLTPGANLGYAAAANLGIAHSAGEDVVVVANTDVVFESDFLSETESLLTTDPGIGVVAPLLMRFDGTTVDSAGQGRSWSLHPRERGYNRPLPAGGFHAGPVFSSCGAVTVFTQKAIGRLLERDGEVYDPDFFMFWEDFDVGWRAQSAGLRVWFDGRVRARHFRSGTLEKGALARVSLALARPCALRVHLVKNRVLCLVKNFCWRADGWRLPFILARDALWMGALTFTAPKTIIGLFRAAPLIQRAWVKRRRRQRCSWTE